MQLDIPDPARLSPGRRNDTALANDFKYGRYFCLLAAVSRVPGAYAALGTPVSLFVDEISDQIDDWIATEVIRCPRGT
jgi:hypothetical protein